jgi:ABC-type Fe3+/spermidine/putrescine transport system ATPase subunit
MYENKPLLTGIDMSVNPGETICLLGASGSGKSTLLRIIAGLETPESGEIFWDGDEISNVPTHKRKFGFMFQDYALFPHMTVAQNIAFGMKMQGFNKAGIAGVIPDTLMRFNLKGYETRRVNDLSGGEQQRVALARTLAADPRLLLLDEPLAALDRSLRKQLLQEIRDVLHETGTPAIYVTHDQEEAFTVADRLLILEGGNFLQNGTPDEVFNHPVSKKVAKFFGLTNQVPGRVINKDNGLAVQTVIGIFNKVPRIADMGLTGDLPRVSLILRKASVMDLTNNQQLENSFTAKVLDVQFSENGYKTTMEARDIKMEFMLEEPHHAGEMIQLVIDPSDINIFQE